MSDKQDPSREELPDGMVRKTRRVRRKRKSTEDTSNRDAGSLFSKAKELLVGMHEEDEDYGPVDVAEQVRRLQKRKEDNRPLDDTWGTKKRSSSWLWILLVAVVAAVIAIIIGIAKLAAPEPILSNLDSTAGDLPPGTIKEFDPGEGPLGWFHENSIEVLAETKNIIRTINNAKTVEEILPYVRSSPYRQQNPVKLEDRGAPMRLNSLTGFSWEPKTVYPGEVISEEGRGYLVVKGRREDGDNFAVYFVQENQRVLIDWDATVGWSERSIAELMIDKPQNSTLVRCLLEKKPSFDQKFGKVEHSGFVLSDMNSDNYFLAYVPLVDDAASRRVIALKKVLNYGSVRLPLLKNKRVTVRAKWNPAGYFEITEFVHPDWVRP